MPFARCPACEQSFHLQVSDVAAWYRERWPQLPLGAEVPEECPICWGKRTGVEFPWAERIRPYRREELVGNLDPLPKRGEACPGCGVVLPRYEDLSPEQEARLRDLVRQGHRITAIEGLIAATGCPTAWAKLWVSHPMGPELHPRESGPACYYCGGALRTAAARQCVECGMDWHDPHRVVRSPAPSPSVVGEMGPPETLGALSVTAWVRIDTGVRPRDRTRHLNPEGPLPMAAGLVIAKDVASGGWSLFHCDADWKVFADSWHPSLAQAQTQAELEFEGMGSRWSYRAPPLAAP